MNDNKSGWKKLTGVLAKAAGMKQDEIESMLTGNELSVDDLREQIRLLVKSSNTDKDCYVWVADIFPDSKQFVAEFYKNSTSKYYRQGYAVSNDVVSLNGEATEVFRRTVYTPVGSADGTMNSSAEIADGEQATETENPTMKKNEDGSFNFSAEEAAEFEQLKANAAGELESARKSALNANPNLTIEMVANINDVATLRAMAGNSDADSDEGKDGSTGTDSKEDGNSGSKEGTEEDSNSTEKSETSTDGNSTDGNGGDSQNASAKNTDFSGKAGAAENAETGKRGSQAPKIFTANAEDKAKILGKST